MPPGGRQCKALADAEARGLAVVSGGTDTHLALIDLRPKGISGKDADEALERALSPATRTAFRATHCLPTKTSGIRVGSPAGTTRGFGVAEFEAIGDMIADVLIACRKRPIDPARIEKLASGIQRQIETSGESEIPAQAIGELVMEGLKGLDSVAYIRFASVYKDFREAKDFEDFASAVKEAGGD
jgi:glycine/serine hydroxymethyltransferase